MNKKICSAIALGLVISQLSPYLIYANPSSTVNQLSRESKIVTTKTNINWSKEYPDLLNPNKKDIKSVSFSKETNLEINQIIELLDDLDKNFSMKKLKKIFNRIFKLNIAIPSEDIYLHEEGDQLDYIIYKATYYAFTNTSGKERDKLFIQIADDMYLSAVKRINGGVDSFLMIDYGVYYSGTLIHYFDDENTKQIFVNLTSMLIIVGNTSVIPPDIPDVEQGYDYTFDENELPSNIKPDTLPDDAVTLRPEESEKLPPLKNEVVEPEDDSIIFGDGQNNGNNQNNYTETEEYKSNGNSCYKVTTKYDLAGNKISENETLLPYSEKGFCNIYNYNVIDGNTWNEKNDSSNDGIDVWESVGENDLSNKSKYSIYFSLNKNNEKPNYYDTGIRLSTDMTATYTQIKDVLTQISLKTNAYVIEDTNKVLFIAEGKPLVIKDKKAEYSEDEIEELLNSFDEIGLKVDEVSQLSSESLEEQADKGELREITFGDKTITLSNNPIVNGSIIQLPIKEVANALGLKVEQTDNKLSIKNDTITFEYDINSNNVSINGTSKILSTKTQLKNNVVYGEMNLLLKELGYTLKYDSFSSKIEILK